MPVSTEKPPRHSKPRIQPRQTICCLIPGILAPLSALRSPGPSRPRSATSDPTPIMDTPPFSELGLPDHLLSAVEALGFERPSPIQAAAIPPALEGKDLVGLSETGSGKTAAFALPALAKLNIK